MRFGRFSARSVGRQAGERGSVRVVVPVAAALAAAALAASGQAYSAARDSAPAAQPARVEPSRSFGNLPLSFEPSGGQTGTDFLAAGSGYSMLVAPTGLTMALTKPAAPARPGAPATAAPEPTVVGVHVVGSDPAARGNGVDRLPGVVNHLVGADPSQWRTGVPTFGKVAYGDVYPGIDLLYYGAQRSLEYDFVVKPGSDPRTIALAFDGTSAARLADNGDLVLSTPAGELRQSKPTLYQDVDGRRAPVTGSFVLRPGNQVGFEVGRYDATRPLVIDPVLDYSTFLGGSANDFGFGIAVDSAGRTYLGGETSSAVFPRSNDNPAGVAKPANQGTDAYVLRMNAAGDAVDFVTFLGGSGADSGQDLAIDSDFNAYLTGSTASGNFPTTASAYDRTCGTDGLCNGNADNFLAKLSPTGSLLYSTFLGGSGAEQHAPSAPYSGAAGIAVRNNTAYLHSNTFSTDFPVTAKAFQTTCVSCADGSSDGYLSVIDTKKKGAAGLLYSTYVGGDGDEQSKGVAVDTTGSAYLTGITVSLAVDVNDAATNSFPVKSAYQPAYNGGYSDGYLVKVDPNASTAAQTLQYSTFLGGGGTDEAWGVAVRGKQAYVTGYTTSGPDPHAALANPADPATDPKPYFPTTPGAYNTTYAGRASTDSGSSLFLDGDAFVFVMNGAGSAPVWSTFVGGPGADYGQGIALDSAGQVYITGWTTCREQDDRATTTVNEAPPQFQQFDDDNNPLTQPITIATGRSPGDPDATGVGDCDGKNPYGANPTAPTNPPPGVFPQVNPIVDPTRQLPAADQPPLPQPRRTLDESVMDSTFIGFQLHNSPTAAFVTNLTADGSNVDYSVLLDGPGFDRGFAITVRDQQLVVDATGTLVSQPITPEVYITGRTGKQGYPVVASPGHGLYDGTYNGAGRDAFISKLVG